MTDTIYADPKYREELLKVLEKCADKYSNPICPYCENDLRKPRDCTNCAENHSGATCYREGKHNDACLLAKHAALFEIEMEARDADK